MPISRVARRFLPVAIGVGALSVAGCSGGAGGASGAAQTFPCAAGNDVLCLQNCNLGCSDTGCERTDIAQNEVIVLQFSQPVDPLSVNSSTIRFRSSSGDQPVGEFFVNGNQVEFVPTLAISGGETFFGFAAGLAYTLTIPGGDGPTVVRSTSGKPFAKTLSCTLRSSRGIVDLDALPPRATLVSPSAGQAQQAPRGIDIVVEFSEFVDPTPFLGSRGPVEFNVRRTRETADPTDGLARECDGQSELVPLAGTSEVAFDPARRVSVVTFRPATPLPANVCVQVTVTSAVTDLAGRSAVAQQFSFETETIELSQVPIVEEFVSAQFFDDDASAGNWGNGRATFARIGGDGRHGTFRLFPTNDGSNYGGVEWLGLQGGKQTYRLDLQGITIPASETFTGSAVAVTDGRFFFEEMIVPADTRLRFKNSGSAAVAPIFTVAGRLEVLGEIDLAGESVGPVAAPLSTTVGQPGGAGGVLGGAGGKGGNRGPGQSPLVAPVTQYDGSNGQGARVVGGHAYAGTGLANSGGRGSTMFPATGQNTSLLFPVAPPAFAAAYTPSAAAGGGGGGLTFAGSPGVVIGNNHALPSPPGLLAANGPAAPGGAALGFLTFPDPFDLEVSSTHFLVGGSGGGGAGSHACLASTTAVQPNKFVVGGGGGGGGGAIALRAGRALFVGPAAKLIAAGGSTPNSSGPTTTSLPAPGGGGSGGSIVLQTGGTFAIGGLVDVRGGVGGQWNRSAIGSPSTVPPAPVPPNGATVQIAGGNGSAGFVRLEAPGAPTIAALPGMQPAATTANVGSLVERDALISLRSKFYSSGLPLGPDWVRYEIHATVNGTTMIFSDDPQISTLVAGIGQPLRALFQPATVDLQTGAVSETGAWCTGVRTTPQRVGIQSAGRNGFRFVLILDTAIATNVTIERVVVAYRN